MNFKLLILFLLVAVACTNRPDDEAAIYIGGASSADEFENFDALLGETLSVLNSKQFEKNLIAEGSRFPTIYMRLAPDDESAPPLTVDARILANAIQGKEGYFRVKAPVALIKTMQQYDAMAGYIGDGESGSVSIGRGHLWNWMRDNSVHRSCAVNTVAHEFSHMISTSETSFIDSTQAIQDRGAALHSGDLAIASYLVGTVAQCTWLEMNGRIVSEEVSECVSVFGHRGFNSGRCSQFSETESVQIKEGLFEPHIILPD